MKQITPHIRGILTQGSFLNAYLIDNEGSLTLVDVGIGGFEKTVIKELATIGKTPSDLARIVITHAHPDHIGGLPALQRLTNATTYAHRLDAAIIRGERGWGFAAPQELNWVNRQMLGIMKNQKPIIARVDREVTDGDTLDEILPGAIVVHLPGHSMGQMGLYLPSEKALIGGDVLMRFPWGLGMPLRAVSPDWNAVKDSIRKVADIPVEVLMLGHGRPILTNAQAQVAAFAAGMK